MFVLSEDDHSNILVNREVIFEVTIIWNTNDSTGGVSLSEDGLTLTFSGLRYSAIRATEGKTKGKWYWEVDVGVAPSTYAGIGISLKGSNIEFGVNYSTGDYRVYRSNGSLWYPEVRSVPTYTTNDVIGVALDMDKGIVSFYKNGVSVGEYTGLIGEWMPMIRQYNTGSFMANFGASQFSYVIPDGYKSYDGSQPNTNKSFILSNGEYKKYKEGSPATLPSWKTVSTTLPTLTQFQEEGMEDLSILDRKIQPVPESPISMTDEGSLGEGKVFKANINLEKHLNIRRIIIK